VCYENGVQVHTYDRPSVHTLVVMRDGEPCYWQTNTLDSTGAGTISFTSFVGGGSVSGTIDTGGSITIDCGRTSYRMPPTCGVREDSSSCPPGVCM
jgi:hypothetical protein